jgi:hypothetical protein
MILHFAYILVFIASGWPLKVTSSPTRNPSVSQLYQYQKGTWLENLVVRPNGKVLATRFDNPLLVEFEPSNASSEPKTIYTFPEALGATGLTKVDGHRDLYAAASGNFSLTAGLTPKSWVIWTIDLQDENKPKVTKFPVPAVALVNGIASLRASEHALVVSDSILGIIGKLDLKTGVYSTVLNNTLTQKLVPDAELGINGIRRHKSSLYFANGNILARVSIHPDGSPASEAEIVGNATNPAYQFDDFAVDGDGTAYLATGNANAITRITPNGQAAIIAGNLNSTQIAQPTSVQIGKSKGRHPLLYVTTAGGLQSPVNGNITVGAQFLSIHL